MQTSKQTNRREFLSKTIKNGILLGTGAAVASTLANPLSAFAQSTESALKTKVASLGITSLKTSRLASTKAINAEIKVFAKYEAAEQETMGKILKDIGASVPTESKEDKEVIASLSKLSGTAFDKAFIQAQVATHEKLKLAVTSLMNGSSDKHTKHITSLALSTINEHTERATMLLNKLS